MRCLVNERAAETRTVRQRHMERVSTACPTRARSTSSSTSSPAIAIDALAFKPDPSFPNFADPNRIQLITVIFSDDPDPKQTVRRAWQHEDEGDVRLRGAGGVDQVADKPTGSSLRES